MLNLKTTLIAATATLIAGSVAVSTFADRGHGGKGKRIERMCGADADTKMQEYATKVQAALNLTAAQQSLFDQMQAQRASVKASICAKVEGKEMTRALRKEIRSEMKDIRKAGKDTHEQFHDSLSDEQQAKMKELRKETRKGKRGKKHHN